MSINPVTNDGFSSLFSTSKSVSQSQTLFGNSVMDFKTQLEMLQENPELADTLPVFDTFSSLLEIKSGRSDTKSIPEIAQDLAENISDLEDVFGNFFDLMGLDTSNEVAFQLDGEGGVFVANNAENSEKIEEIFTQNPRLVSQYAVAAARASLINAYETDSGFKSAFDYDPRQAIKDNIDLLKDKLLNGQMVYKDRELTPTF